MRKRWAFRPVLLPDIFPGRSRRLTKAAAVCRALGLDEDYFKPDVTEAIETDGGYRLSASTAAALMGIGRDDLLDLLEEGAFTFGRVWKNRGAVKRTCWISRILFEQETGIPVPVKE